MEFDDYMAVMDCKHHLAIPYMNKDALEVYCTRDLDADTLKLPIYMYAPRCSLCIGTGCTFKESRKRS